MKHQGTIPPDKVAFKIAAMQNFLTPRFREQAVKYPRIREVLWSLQWHSRQPGGIGKFVETFLEQFPDRIGTDAMRAIEKTDKPYTPKERESAMSSIPQSVHKWDSDREWLPVSDPASEFWSSIESFRYESGGSRLQVNQARVNSLNHPQFREVCHKAAQEDLARHLARFCTPEFSGDDDSDDLQCEDIPLENVWDFHDIMGALIEMLDIHAARILDDLAMTEVARKSSRCDGICPLGTRPGDDRRQLTIRQNPMRQNLLCGVAWQSPPLQHSLLQWRERPLRSFIAEAFGISFSFETRTRELRAKNRIYHPAWRIDACWGRSPLRLAIQLLPQHNAQTVKLASHSNHGSRIARWCSSPLHRTLPIAPPNLLNIPASTPPNLPDALCAQSDCRIQLETADLIAVARKHFPEFSENYLRLIAAKAMQSESYLATVQQIAKLARYIAKRDGSHAPNHP